jgi:raffinose/stachyose/melibiose transport system permease protein
MQVISRRTRPAVRLAGATADHLGPSLPRRIYKARLAYAFLIPTTGLLMVFAYYPAFSALYHSFFEWDGFTKPTFVGLDNFTRILHSPDMQAAFGNVLQLALFAVIVNCTIPLAVARLILKLRGDRLQYAFRVMFVIPLIVTNVVIYLIWQFIYDPTFGVLNRLILAVHIGSPQGWLGDPKMALYSLMGIGFPWIDGFALLIFTAGLQNIPASLLEAAAIDGATGWRTFRRVELPLVMRQVKLIATLNLIWTIQSFTTVLILTKGGPGTSTLVPGMALYRAGFDNGEMGYACAIGTIMFLIMLVLTVINLRYVPSYEYNPAQRKRL